MRFTIEMYETASGTCPTREFIFSLSPKLSSKILRDIDLLKEFGTQLREPYTKHLDDGIFELRTQFGKARCRSLYFFNFDKTIVITNAFLKTTRKTPIAEIEKAKAYRKDWIERYTNEVRRSKERVVKKSSNSKGI